jgi:TolA-binding protein
VKRLKINEKHGIRNKMNIKNRNINGNRSKLQETDGAGFNVIAEDEALFGTISDVMRGYLDIEDVKNDPSYLQADEEAGKLVSDFNTKTLKHGPYSKFVKDSIEGKKEEQDIDNEITAMQYESSKNDLDKVTVEWVREWHQKRQKGVTIDAKGRERKDFVTSSLQETGPDISIKDEAVTLKRRKSSIFLRYALPAAAAVIGALLIVRTLLPSQDTDTIYARNFETPAAISPVTRGDNSNVSASYLRAIENYNNMNYQAAAAGFSLAIQQDNTDNSSLYYMGITQMELGNYNQAVTIFENIVSRQGEYLKEATWYLGLAYLKTGNTEKASGCFKTLAGSPGYYHDRAEKILRRLR